MGDHDTLFKRAFSVPEHAAGELASVLPESVVARLDLGALRLVPASFVDAEMKHRHADLLFAAPLRQSRKPAYLYFLLEHQSEPDAVMPFRALSYATRVWGALLRAERDRRELPPLVTIVVHHGPEGWTAPRRLHEMIDGLDEVPELARFVPDLELLVDDLTVATDEVLAARPLSPLPKVAVWLLRDARDVGALLAHLAAWAGELEKLVREDPRREDALFVLRYILRVAGDVPFEVFRQRIVEIAPTIEEPMASFEEQLIQKGVEKGRVLALRETLRRLLQARFGTLDASADAQIEGASRAELDRWVERVVAAANVDDVLGG